MTPSMYTMCLRMNVMFYEEIVSFIKENILIANNFSGVADDGINNRDENLFRHFAKLVNTGDYYKLFENQYLTSKKKKSQLFIDAKFIWCVVLNHDEEYFYKNIKTDDGVLRNCLVSIMLGILNAMRHEGLLKKLVNKHHDQIFNIAVNKLKRNRIVNEGFFLKVSIRDCGMF